MRGQEAEREVYDGTGVGYMSRGLLRLVARSPRRSLLAVGCAASLPLLRDRLPALHALLELLVFRALASVLLEDLGAKM